MRRPLSKLGRVQVKRLALASDKRFTTETVFAHLAGGTHLATVETVQSFLQTAGVVADELEIEKLVHWYNSIRPEGLEHSE